MNSNQHFVKNKHEFQLKYQSKQIPLCLSIFVSSMRLFKLLVLKKVFFITKNKSDTFRCAIPFGERGAAKSRSPIKRRKKCLPA